MDQINSTSVTSNDVSTDSIDSTVLIYALALGLLTGLGLACTTWIFKLDKDLGQIIVYPLVLVAYVYLFRTRLPKVVIQALLSTLVLLIFSYLWTQGDFGSRGVSFISKRLIGSANPMMEQLRVDFNWDSEALNYPKLETIYRNFDDRSAEEWGKDSYRLLIYSDPASPRLKLFLNELSEPLVLENSGVSLKIQLFPEWIPIDPKGIPVDYLATFTRVLPWLERQKDGLQKLEDLGFSGYAAGISKGRWSSLVPRTAALFLGASSNLAKNKVLGKAELKCIRRQLASVIAKTRLVDSPELRALALNNLAVTIFLLSSKEQPQKAAGLARKALLEAISIRSSSGQVTNGARLAVANLFALEGAGFTTKGRNRKTKLQVRSQSRRLKKATSTKSPRSPRRTTP